MNKISHSRRLRLDACNAIADDDPSIAGEPKLKIRDGRFSARHNSLYQAIHIS